MKKQFIFIAVIFLVCSIYVCAACPPECSTQASITPDSYSNQASYSNSDFYANSDPAKWKWNLVDWNNQGLQQALNTNPEASKRYMESKGCLKCSIGNTGNVNLAFSQNGISHPNGGFVSANSNYPQGTSFEATADNIIAHYPASSTISVPVTDTVTIDTGGETLTLTGSNMPPDTNVFGKITFKNGQAYFRTDEDLYINYVQISRSAMTGETPSSNEAMIFFTGNYVPGVTTDYVSINPASKNFFVYADDEPGGIIMNFGPGNPFFQSNDAKGHPILRDTDKVSLFAAYNNEMYYVAPSTVAGYPVVKVKETSDDKLVYSVTNGPFSFSKNYDSNIEGQVNEIFAELDPNLKLTTTPMLINPIDSSDNPIMSAYANGKQVNLTSISIDGHNRVFFITDTGSLSLDYDFYLQQGLQPGQTLPPLEINGRQTRTFQVGDSKIIITTKTYSENDLRDIVQMNPDYKIISGVPANKIDIFKQFIEELPEEMLNSFRGIAVQPNVAYTYAAVTESKKLSYFNTGALSKEGGIITAPDTYFWCEECSDEYIFDRINGLLIHEIGHEFVMRKRNEEGLAWYESDSTFDKKWEATYGNTPPPYGKLSKQENPFTVSLKWIKSIDVRSDDPYDSFLNAYANTNNDEYKAVAFETFNSDAEYVKSTFLDPNSKFYDARYLKQIELLCEEGGIKAKNCQAFGVPYK